MLYEVAYWPEFIYISVHSSYVANQPWVQVSSEKQKVVQLKLCLLTGMNYELALSV